MNEDLKKRVGSMMRYLGYCGGRDMIRDLLAKCERLSAQVVELEAKEEGVYKGAVLCARRELDAAIDAAMLARNGE